MISLLAIICWKKKYQPMILIIRHDSLTWDGESVKNLDITDDECYLDYLTVFGYHIEEILREKGYYGYTDYDYLIKRISYEEVMDRVKDELTDETRFMLNEIESRQVFRDAVEFLIYLYVISKA